MERDDINWQYVLTKDNPADLGSRGSLLNKIPEILSANNCRKNKKSRPLTTTELVNQKKNYIKREQEKVVSSDRSEDDKKRLNLEKNDEGVYIC